MKKLAIFIIFVMIIGATYYYFVSTKKKPPEYKTEQVTTGNLSESVTALGTVNPIISTIVGAQVSGLIKKIYVGFNSPVKKGQLLAEIDPSIFESQVMQAQANLYAAKANVEKIKSITENDEKTYNRNKELVAQDFIPKSDLDLAEATYKSDLAQINAAKAQVVQAQATLKNAETNLRYTKILSPVSGVVISKNVDVGQTVAASFQTPTLFLVAQDLTKMQIDTNVAEADIGKIKDGQQVEYTLDGYPNETFVGKVKQVRNSPTIIQNVVTYDVVIQVNNKDLKLKPGMTANVSIITSKKTNVMMVSNAALRFTPDKDKTYKTPGIWILDKGKPKRINIKIGISNGNYTEIISKDIKKGQDVILEEASKPKNARRPSGGGHGMF